jgi:hypothetical protein
MSNCRLYIAIGNLLRRLSFLFLLLHNLLLSWLQREEMVVVALIWDPFLSLLLFRRNRSWLQRETRLQREWLLIWILIPLKNPTFLLLRNRIRKLLPALVVSFVVQLV